jgi:hypothetical protein
MAKKKAAKKTVSKKPRSKKKIVAFEPTVVLTTPSFLDRVKAFLFFQ